MSDARIVTDRASFRATACDAPPGSRVPVELSAQIDDPFEAYRRARSDRGGAYLATTGGQSGWGYFSVDPIERHVVTPDDVRDGAGSLDRLQSIIDDERLARGDCSVPYPCGVIGWFSYDIAREIESLPDETNNDRVLPRLQCNVYDALVSWEEPRPSDGPVNCSITVCPAVEAADDIDAVYDRAVERAHELLERCRTGDPAVGTAPAAADAATFESDCGREAFADRVREIKGYIRDGDTFQTNVSQRLTAPAAVHPVDAFDALRAVNPAPYSALLEFDGVDLVSASPELLLERNDRRVATEPIAGTRPRGATEQEDAELEAELTGDEKERAEHAMLVDLERNDLGKVCAYGSVEVSEYRRVDRYSEVMHLVSLVEGRLRPDATLADAIEATFPGGTITGAPKPRTMELIEAVETTRRGPYTGSIGIIGFDDRATLNITIRTLVRHGDQYYLRVGAGIVDDSAPKLEYAETLDKARALVTAVDEALGERAELSIDGDQQS